MGPAIDVNVTPNLQKVQLISVIADKNKAVIQI